MGNYGEKLWDKVYDIPKSQSDKAADKVDYLENKSDSWQDLKEEVSIGDTDDQIQRTAKEWAKNNFGNAPLEIQVQQAAKYYREMVANQQSILPKAAKIINAGERAGAGIPEIKPAQTESNFIKNLITFTGRVGAGIGQGSPEQSVQSEIEDLKNTYQKTGKLPQSSVIENDFGKITSPGQVVKKDKSVLDYVKDIGSNLVGRAKEGYAAATGGYTYSTANKEIDLLDKEMQALAKDITKKQLGPDASDDELIKTAKSIYDQLAAQTDFETRKNVAPFKQMGAEVIFDPLTYGTMGLSSIPKLVAKSLPVGGKLAKAAEITGNVLPKVAGGVLFGAAPEFVKEGFGGPGAIVGGLVGAATELPGIKKAVNSAFKYLPEADQIANGNEALASELRARVDAGTYKARKSYEDSAELLSKVPKLNKKEKGIVANALEAKITLPDKQTESLFNEAVSTLRQVPEIERPKIIDELTKELSVDFGDDVAIAFKKFVTEIEPQQLAAQKAFGSGFKWDESGVLSKVPEMEAYMPHAAFEEKLSSKGQFKPTKNVQSVFTKSRKGAEGVIQDPLLQFATKRKEVLAKEITGSQLKEFTSVLDENGMIHSLDSTKKLDKPEMLQQIADNFTEQHGIEYVALRTVETSNKIDTLEDVYHQLSGNVGIKKKEKIVFAPRAYVDYAAKKLPAFLDSQDVATNMKLTEKLMASFFRQVRPYQSLVKKTAVSGGIFATAYKNFVTSIGIGVDAGGIASLSPSRQFDMLNGSIKMASKDPEAISKLKGIKYTSITNEQLPLDELAQYFQDHGMSKQYDQAIGVDTIEEIVQKNRAGTMSLPEKIADTTVGNLGRGLNWGVDKIINFGGKASIRSASTISENYQRFNIFLSSVTDMSKESLNKALDRASKFGGNYNRMTDFERNVLNDMLMFYGWMKTSGTELYNVLKEHPERTAGWLKLRKLAAGIVGDDKERDWTSYKEYQENDLIPIRQSLLPDKLKVQEGMFTGIMPNDPFKASMDTLSGLAKNPKASLGPAMKVIVEGLTGMDSNTGEPLDRSLRLPSLVSIQDFKNSVSKNFWLKALYNPIQRPSNTFINMIQFLNGIGKEDVANQMWINYAITRLSGVVDIYPVDEAQNKINAQSKAQKSAEDELKQVFKPIKE